MICGCGGIGRHASLRSRAYYNINNIVSSIVVTPVKNAIQRLLTAKYGYGLASIYPLILLGIHRPRRRRIRRRWVSRFSTKTPLTHSSRSAADVSIVFIVKARYYDNQQQCALTIHALNRTKWLEETPAIWYTNRDTYYLHWHTYSTRMWWNW